MSILSRTPASALAGALDYRTVVPWIVAAVLLLLFALMAGALPWKFAVLGMAALTVAPSFVFGFIRLDIGVLFTVTIGFFVELVRKYSDAPFGVALDGLVFIFALSMVAGLAKTKDFSAARHPISLMVLVWMYYCGVQLVNPEPTAHRMAWLYTVRSLGGLLFMYFIAVYALDTLPKIKRAIKWILFLGLVAALYGLKQEFVGFSQTELTWLYSDEKRLELIFQWSRLRIFSLFSDPTTLGIVMAYLSCMSIALMFGPYKNWQKAALFVAVLAMVAAMGFAGSRTPIVVLPVGLIFFVVLLPKKNVLLISAFLFAFGTLAMMKSSGNPVLFRIQSAFKPGEDASVQVRLDNQALVQPFIQKHPIGSGLGTTGEWGRRFAPNFWLAYFAHDSGLVRIAVEAGYIGLIIYEIFLGVILISGIRQVFRVRDPVVKNLTIAIAVVMFCLALSSYPQEAIPMLPTSLIFYILLACQVRLDYIDKQQRKLAEENGEDPSSTPPPIGRTYAPSAPALSR